MTGDEREGRGRHHGHRSLDQRLDALEEEREKDNKWQKRASERIGQHEKQLEALELGVGLGGSVLRLVSSIEALTAALSRDDTSTGRTSIHVLEVGPLQGGLPMPLPVDHSPPFKIHSSYNYAILGVTGPKKADGTYAGPGAWSTTDDPATAPPDGSAQLASEPMDSGIVEQADPNWVDPGDGSTPPIVPILDEQGNQIPVHRVKVLTPLTQEVVAELPGAKAGGVLLWKSDGMRDTEIVVEYSDPALGRTVITGSEHPEA